MTASRLQRFCRTLNTLLLPAPFCWIGPWVQTARPVSRHCARTFPFHKTTGKSPEPRAAGPREVPSAFVFDQRHENVGQGRVRADAPSGRYAVRDGMDRGSAARIGGMDRQTLRDWVHRFNAPGPEGLIDQGGRDHHGQRIAVRQDRRHGGQKPFGPKEVETMSQTVSPSTSRSMAWRGSTANPGSADGCLERSEVRLNSEGILESGVF